MKIDDLRIKARIPWTMASELKPTKRNGPALNGAREAALKFAALRTDEQFMIWEKIWQEVFGENFHHSGLIVPERQAGFDWLIAVPNLTLPCILAVIRERSLFRFELVNVKADAVASFWDPWRVKPRPALAPYLVWVRARFEPDCEFEKKSARDLARLRLNSITLEARILLEILIRELTGETGLLDRKVRTLCSGSRDGKGLVPCVHWNSAFTKPVLQISAWFPTDRSEIVTAREAIT